MKYHAKIFDNDSKAICGIKIKAHNFAYPLYNFRKHYAKEYACKKCDKIITKKYIKERIGNAIF